MRNKKAFSLIELSIVILIVGIIIAGVTQSSILINKFRLKSAASLTKSSGVDSIKDNILWLETTLEDGLGDVEDESLVSSWRDINSLSSSKNNATANASARPTYVANCHNGIPCLRFDGVDDELDFDGADLVNGDYTIFIVEKKTGTGAAYFLGGSSSGANEALKIGYMDDIFIEFSHQLNEYNASITLQDQGKIAVHNFVLDSDLTKKYYRNGVAMYLADGTNTTSMQDALLSYDNPKIGSFAPDSNFYQGDIFEVLMFKRALLMEERRSIERYLADKYDIELSYTQQSAPIPILSLPVVD